MGGEAWPSCVRVSPARLAAARVPHPLPWQRPARPHACAPVSRSCSLLAAPSCAPVSAAAPPQRLQRYKSFCISLFKLSSRLNQSPPAASPEQLQPCRLPVPSHPSCPCAAVRAGGLPAASSAGQPLARGVRADPRRGQQRAGWQQGGMGWADAVGGKGRLIFLSPQRYAAPCFQVFTASLQLFYSAFMTACRTPGILLIACRKGHCRGARLPSIQTPPPMQIYECADSMILRHSSRSSQGSPAPGLPRYRRTEAEIHLTRLCHRTGYACTPEGGRYE